MALFWADSVAVCCSNVAVVKSWWIDCFGCKVAKVPADWDCTLPSDVALQLPGQEGPTILLSDWSEVHSANYSRSNDHTIVYCSKISKAREHLAAKGVGVGPIQGSGGIEFFEIRDPEGNAIEICTEV